MLHCTTILPIRLPPQLLPPGVTADKKLTEGEHWLAYPCGDNPPFLVCWPFIKITDSIAFHFTIDVDQFHVINDSGTFLPRLRQFLLAFLPNANLITYYFLDLPTIREDDFFCFHIFLVFSYYLSKITSDIYLRPKLF